jgi:hypothetical protein
MEEQKVGKTLQPSEIQLVGFSPVVNDAITGWETPFISVLGRLNTGRREGYRERTVGLA